MSEYNKPVPVSSPESKPYWAGLREHRLMMPACKACGNRWFPPSFFCPRCNAGDIEWLQVSGQGKIFSYVVFHRVYHRGFTEDVPYVVALVELEEGPRMLSNVIGVDIDKVACEMPVRVVYDDITDRHTLPKFKPIAVLQADQV